MVPRGFVFNCLLLLGLLEPQICLAETKIPARGQPAWGNKAPSTKEWRYFHALPRSKKQKLWDLCCRSAHSLSHLRWQWRLAWVISCERDHLDHCANTLKQALFDKALVVRARGAQALGIRYRGSNNQEIIQLLEKAYTNKGNYRNEKPMFIQYKILLALKQIGGEACQKAGKRLAMKYHATADYWQSLYKRR